jgi:hypothetical protein
LPATQGTTPTAPNYYSTPNSTPNSTTPPSTFRDDAPRDGATPSSGLKPIPDAGVKQDLPGSQPRLIDPESRVTARPMHSTAQYTSLVWDNGSAPSEPATTATSPDNNVMWRASNR